MAAAARIASPSFVRWKRRNSSPLTASSTATIPRDSYATRIPAISVEPSGKMLGKLRFSKPQIQPAALLMRMKSPSVTIRIVSWSASSTGRISTRSTTMPPTKESTKVTSRASPSGTPPSTSPQAMKVENIAISPWAKLTMPVERKMSTSASASAP